LRPRPRPDPDHRRRGRGRADHHRVRAEPVPSAPGGEGSRPGTGGRAAIGWRPVNICVFCSSSRHIDDKYLRLASDVGTELARRGHTLVSGGATVSCMGAITRAVRAAGGRTIGVIPQVLVDIEVADEDSDELIVTADMRERKGQMDARSDAFLVLPGGI